MSSRLPDSDSDDEVSIYRRKRPCYDTDHGKPQCSNVICRKKGCFCSNPADDTRVVLDLTLPGQRYVEITAHEGIRQCVISSAVGKMVEPEPLPDLRHVPEIDTGVVIDLTTSGLKAFLSGLHRGLSDGIVESAKNDAASDDLTIDDRLKRVQRFLPCACYNGIISAEGVTRVRDPEKRLEDDDVNAFLGILSASRPDDIHCMQSHFCVKLLRGDDMCRWWKVLDENPRCKMVFIPVHMCDMEHWYLVAVDLEKTTIDVYDSLGATHTKEALLIKQWLEKKFPGSTFEIRHNIHSSIHQQEDGTSCGIFACSAAASLAYGRKVDCTQADIVAVRRLIGSTLLWYVLVTKI